MQHQPDAQDQPEEGDEGVDLPQAPQGGSVRVEWLDDAGQRGSVQQLLLLEK